MRETTADPDGLFSLIQRNARRQGSDVPPQEESIVVPVPLPPMIDATRPKMPEPEVSSCGLVAPALSRWHTRFVNVASPDSVMMVLVFGAIRVVAGLGDAGHVRIAVRRHDAHGRDLESRVGREHRVGAVKNQRVRYDAVRLEGHR
jgi:hypothetical protein